LRTASGGLANKVGNRHERRWTIGCLGSLLKDEWESIDLEPYDGVKIEFHARQAIGDEAVERALAEGRAMDPEAVVA
jgi:hypothetical protein